MAGLDAEVEKPAGQARDCLDELHSGFAAAGMDGEGGVAAEASQAVADVGLGVHIEKDMEGEAER